MEWWLRQAKDPVTVLLSPDEMAHARWLANERMMHSDDCDLERYAPKACPQIVYDLEGALAETSFAVYAGRPWPTSVRAFREPDFVPDIQIRSIGHDEGGVSVNAKGLLHRSHDNPSERFVLVRVVHEALNSPTNRCYLMGWLVGSDIRQRGTPRGDWWTAKVPQLNGMTALDLK